MVKRPETPVPSSSSEDEQDQAQLEIAQLQARVAMRQRTLRQLDRANRRLARSSKACYYRMTARQVSSSRFVDTSSANDVFLF